VGILSAVVLAGGKVLSFGGGAISIGGGSGPPPQGNFYKFIPGDMIGSGVVYETSVANAVADIQQAIAAGLTGFSGYVAGHTWGTLETSTVSTSPTYNYGIVWAIFNYLQAVWPGAAYGVYITGEHHSPLHQTDITAANLNNPAGYFVPAYILNCGGSVTIPNSFGSGSTTAYPVAPVYSGGSSYGVCFGSYSGLQSPASNETMGYVIPQWYNPGVTQAWQNMLQGLALSTPPTPAAYNAGTVYSAGIQVTSGGNTYTFINAANSSGHAPPNATYWVQTNQNYVGLTLDQNPLVFGWGNNDEASYSFTNGQNFSVGITVNPPQSVSGAAPSNTNFGIQYNKWNSAVASYTPTTPFWLNYTFGYDVQGYGSDSNVNVAANVNQNLSSGNRTTPAALSTIIGLAYSSSDTFGLEWNSAAPAANWGAQGYYGIASPTTGGALPAPAVANLIGQMPWVAQVQPYDYAQSTGTTSNTAAAVAAIMAASVVTKSQWRIWCMNDDVNSGGPSWPTYIRNAIVANQATYPISTLRPTYLMSGITISSVIVASSTSLTIAWTGLALNAAETGLTGTLYRNGVSIATGLTVTSSSNYTDTGLTQGTTYTYTMAMANSNGTGPQGAGVQGTTSSPSWQTLPVGGGGYVRGLIVAADGTMVGRTDTAGAYLYNGTSWNQLVTNTSLPSAYVASNPLNLGGDTGSQGVYEVAIAPSNTSIFYMNFGGYVFSSANKGTSWTQTAYTQDTSCNANDSYGQYGQKMAVDPANSSIVYAGGETSGLRVTINGGTSWSTVSGVPAGTTAGITGILFDPSSSVVGNVTQGIYACRNGTGVYHSANGGSTWALTAGGPTTIINAAIDTSGNYYATVAGSGSIFKYSGGAWSSFATGDGNLPQTIAINPFNQSEVVCVDIGGQVIFTYNAGATWTGPTYTVSLSAVDIPWLKAANLVGGNGLPYLDTGGSAFSPITNGKLFVSSGTGVWSQNFPLGANGSTPFTWNDMSVGIENLVANAVIVPPVTSSTPILASDDRPFFDIANVGTYPSTYGPVNSVTIEMGWSVDYASSSPSTVLGVSTWNGSNQSGVSTNNGASWTNFSSQWSNANGGCIAASSPTNIVWAPAGGNQPGYTINGGSSWTGITLPGVSSWGSFFSHSFTQSPVCADRVSANTFYLYYPSFGVFTTSNSGATWSNVYNGNSGYIEANHGQAGYSSTLISVPGNAGHLFYTGGPLEGNGSTLTSPVNEPFYRSINGGAAWTAVSNVLAVSYVGFGAIAPGKTYPAIYIYGWVSNVLGVWQSVDDCVTWTNLGAFPTGVVVQVSCISGDPNIFGRVYVGFAGGGYAYYG
jgi:hypothetical protein